MLEIASLHFAKSPCLQDLVIKCNQVRKGTTHFNKRKFLFDSTSLDRYSAGLASSDLICLFGSNKDGLKVRAYPRAIFHVSSCWIG